MTRLFYKDLKAHEAAYRNTRADEAVNDLILGAKVNAYTGMEDAKNNAIDEIATNYGKFLKALQTKEIPLLNQSTTKEKAVQAAAEDGNTSSVSNMLMPSSQRKTESLTDASTRAGLQAQYTPEQKKIADAYNIAHNATNVASALKQVKTALGGENSVMVKNFEHILHENGYKASTNSKSKTSSLAVPNLQAIQTVIGAMQAVYFNPTQ